MRITNDHHAPSPHIPPWVVCDCPNSHQAEGHSADLPFRRPEGGNIHHPFRRHPNDRPAVPSPARLAIDWAVDDAVAVVDGTVVAAAAAADYEGEIAPLGRRSPADESLPSRPDVDAADGDSVGIDLDSTGHRRRPHLEAS